MKTFFKIVFSLMGIRGIVKYIFLGLVSGLSSFLFISLVTHIVSLLTKGSYTVISREYLLAFFAIILFFSWARKSLSYFSVKVSQKIVWNIRKQLLKLLIHANYPAISTKKDIIRASIVSDIGALANAAIGSIDFSIQIVMAIACLIYLASISLILFIITMIISAIGITAYAVTTNRSMEHLKNARKVENKFQKNLNAILDGFKEIYMEPKKGKYIYAKVCENADESYDHQITATTGLINNQIIGQVLSYLLITSVLLIFSLILSIEASKIIGFIFTLMYLLGSISTVTSLFPSIMMAKVAAGNIEDLRVELFSSESQDNNAVDERINFNFQILEIKNLLFNYGQEEHEFKIGPIDFVARQGETIFIYGGNGSGKTTFLYSLLGIFQPAAGSILLNNVDIHKDNFFSYKTFFGVVFNDFYIFEGLISLNQVDLQKWQRYINLFELDQKVTLENLSFSSTDLSTGQRKRLALVSILLEEKPILVLDEWAADQDPYFREKFYLEIIPILIQDGYTIIAVTHDDKYYHCADRVYKMEEGKLLAKESDFTSNMPINEVN